MKRQLEQQGRLEWRGGTLIAPAVILVSALVWAQSGTGLKVSDIKRDGNLINEQVRIDGTVTQFIEDPARTTGFYLLKDDWGGIIKVRTSRGSPNVGVRYSVIGVVTHDPKLGERFISEDRRIELGAPSGDVAGQGSQLPHRQVEPPGGGGGGLDPVFVALIAAILLAFVVLAWILLRIMSQQKGEQSGEALPEPEEMIEGKTIKLARPPDKTLKLLPGRLAVEAGDDTVKEIRFHHPPGSKEAEFTFGRASGTPYSHVQLKAPTISSKHAKLIFADGGYTLVNYSSTNPTLYAGSAMAVNASARLQDGDRIEMGEVVFVFHEQ